MSVLSQCGVLTKPILIFFKSMFLGFTIFSSSNIERKRDRSSIDLVINPKVSIVGEFERIPDLSKSP